MIAKSGEPDLLPFGFQEEGKQPLETAQFWDLCSRVRQFQQEYLNYWEQSATRTKSGATVDCIITPIAPSAAVRRNKFVYYGT